MKELIFLSLYLLASARGAPPGQPDELLNSIDQASVQQLSSEYFSLASPSDVEALYETPSGEKGLTDHSSSEHEPTEHAANEHVSSEHTSEHSSEHNSGDHISGEHITEEHITAEHTSSDHDHTSESADQSGEQSSEVASAEQVSSEKTEESDEQTSEATSGEKNEAISTAFPSTSAEVAINCHTCSYMNDEGKCLHGEGVCTTQNSQQCMLKKIFEGGKLQYMVQGCETMCPSMNLFSHGTRTQIICCRNEPLCNKT